eukprot:1349684-Amorphochlora_amoeboformis.AAC.1
MAVLAFGLLLALVADTRDTADGFRPLSTRRHRLASSSTLGRRISSPSVRRFASRHRAGCRGRAVSDSEHDFDGKDPKSSRGWKFFKSLGSPKVWVAPMVDGSELPYRLLCQKYGVNAAYSPMLHARIFCDSAKYRKEHFR